MDNRYNRHNRRKYNLKAHIVLVTKYRKHLLKDSIADDVKQKIFNICKSKEWEIIAMETDKDHIHFLVEYDATDRICEIVKPKFPGVICNYINRYASSSDKVLGNEL